VPIANSLCLRCKQESGRCQGFRRDGVRRVLSRPLNAYGLSDEGDAFFFGIPIDPTDNLDNNGYFNANMSFASVPPPATVPGPLPLLGAAVGFSLSRRLRKRIQATK